MNSGSSPWAPRYLTLPTDPPTAPGSGLLPPASPPVAAADPRRGIDGGALDLRDDPLDRPAGNELNDGEGHQHDAEQRRDHQQKAFEDIGAHSGK